ncbi:anti-sigma factor antagonist [Streptomyces sp. NPDC051105]|uniref:anti-sigma factor antagonist n=1 Tax=Streptomyces sp. NPDC051105 TaxID=3154843 RepID=UPI00341F1ED9
MREPEPSGAGRATDRAGARELPGLTIRSRDAGDRTVVTVCGDLDLTTDQQLQRALRSALLRSPRGIALDLGGVGFCDCSGLNTLLNIRRQALKDSKEVTISHVSPAVERILEIMGALPLFAPDTVPDGQEHPDDAANTPPPVDGDGIDIRTEVVQLRRALQTRDTIDLARGILMAAFVLTPEEAWSVLVATSQNTNTKLHLTARQLVDSIRGGPLPAATQEQLSAAVTQVAAARETAENPE